MINIHYITFKKIIQITVFLFIVGCNQNEKFKVKETCNQFINTRIALETGDSLQIKSITEKSLFKLIMLNYRYEKILGVPGFKPNLNIKPLSIEIEGDSASCLMSGDERYLIHLYKDSEKWIVIGENDIYPTLERISKVEKQIIEEKKRIEQRPIIRSIILTANSFTDATNLYFKNQNLDSLKVFCDDASIAFIQRIYSYSKKRTGLETLIDEIEQPKAIAFEPSFEDEKVFCKYYNDNTNIILIEKDKRYKVIGFHGIESKDMTNQIIEKQYLNLLRALGLIRSERYRSKNIK